MPSEIVEYRDLYFSEAHQQFDYISDALRELERARDNRAVLETAFRAAHTLKGMSATMGYEQITSSAHALEDLLQGVRERPGGATASDLFFLFRALDSLRQVFTRLETAEIHPREPVLQENSTSPLPQNSRSSAETSRVIRVTSEQLDHLNDVIHRLIVSSLQFSQPESDRARTAAQHVGLAKELQDVAWHLQMAPIGETFNRYPRMLYDLARELDKEVRVHFEGAEVEVGRSILEEINEPLLHLLRNAIVHGIESTSERMKAGKEPRGTIRVSAGLEEETLLLKVADDGRGLDAQLILETARAQGFISAKEQRTLGEAEAFKLITRPGFSLSTVITPVSGRGVGMDAVQAKVETLRGHLDIRSEPGHGTTFTIQVPRTLGPIQVELVRVGDQVYALPAVRIESQFGCTRAELARGRAGETPFLNPTLRVFELQTLLSLTNSPPSPEQCAVIALRHPGEVALVVDELLGRGLWNRPAEDQVPSVILLDLDQLIPAI